MISCSIDLAHTTFGNESQNLKTLGNNISRLKGSLLRPRVQITRDCNECRFLHETTGLVVPNKEGLHFRTKRVIFSAEF